MTMAWGKKVFLPVCGMCLSLVSYYVFGYCFFMALGFLVGVTTISFALPIDLYKSLWNSENGQFTKILFSKVVNYCYNYPDRLENHLQFLSVLIQT